MSITAHNWTEEEATGFGIRLRDLRMQAELTQSELVDRMGSHNQSVLSEWERGARMPPAHPKTVFNIEEALGCEPGALASVLGFVPVGQEARCTAEFAIISDPNLPGKAKRILLETYEALKSSS